MVGVIAATGIQVKLAAPLAVMEAVCPLQSTEGLDITVTVGVGLTLIVIAAVPVHKPVVPVTV
jgi:hypothetical protein